MKDTVQMWENILRGSIKDAEDASMPLSILTGLHNICAHGDLLENVGLSVTDESLHQLFEGFDLSIAALKKMGC